MIVNALHTSLEHSIKPLHIILKRPGARVVGDNAHRSTSFRQVQFVIRFIKHIRGSNPVHQKIVTGALKWVSSESRRNPKGSTARLEKKCRKYIHNPKEEISQHTSIGDVKLSGIGK